MNDPLVSIIIPVYNQANYLGESVTSAINQTYLNKEILIIDDGSTDHSREIAAQFSDQVRYIWQENKGLGGARNSGILAAQGDFIALLDADDQWLPHYLEKMVLLAGQYPDAAVYFCRARGIDAKGIDLPQVYSNPVSQPDFYKILLRANFLIPSTILANRSIILSAGLFEQTNRAIHGCEDWDLWLRLAPKYKFIGTRDILVRYRLHSNTLSVKADTMQRAVRAVIEKNFGSEDGNPETWSAEKRRAYGGVYRYFLISSVLRQNDWSASSNYFCKGLLADPTLAKDLDLFYELALGSQPSGYRGSSQYLPIAENAGCIVQMLENAYDNFSHDHTRRLRSVSFGTAYYALGLVAYNTGNRMLSRSYFYKALWYRWDLIRSTGILSSFTKSFISPSILDKLRNFVVRQ